MDKDQKIVVCGALCILAYSLLIGACIYGSMLSKEVDSKQGTIEMQNAEIKELKAQVTPEKWNATILNKTVQRNVCYYDGDLISDSTIYIVTWNNRENDGKESTSYVTEETFYKYKIGDVIEFNHTSPGGMGEESF